MFKATEDISTVTPDSQEVRAKSKIIFLRKTTVNEQGTGDIKPENFKIINSSLIFKYINEPTTEIVSQPQHVSDSTPSVQTNRTIKPDIAAVGATSKSLAKLLSFEKGISTYHLNKTIDPDAIYVPRFHIKMNNEIDKMDPIIHNSVLKAVRFKRDIKTISVPHVQYAPVDIAFRAQLTDVEVVPPKPKFSQYHGPVATRTPLKHLQMSKNDTLQKSARNYKWPNLKKKNKLSKKFTSIPKKNHSITIDNKTTFRKSQNFFKNLYLDVMDLENPTNVIKAKSKQLDGEKRLPRFKRDLPESITEYVAIIEEPKEITILNVTPNSIIEQTVPNTVLVNLNHILTKNLTGAVHDVLDELNLTTFTPPDDKFPGSDLLFKVPSKYM